MKNYLSILFLFSLSFCFSQATTELTPTGFPSVTFEKPQRTPEKLIERARSWALSYNRNSDGAVDVYDVTDTSLNIDAFRNKAFYYRNRGELYSHRIRYTLKIVFDEKSYSVGFILKEVYSDNRLTTLTTADFFAPDGRLKEDYEEVKPSLESTANTIINSFATFMASE